MLDPQVQLPESRSPFAVGLASDGAEVLDAQRLRYEVFGVEQGARLPSARGASELARPSPSAGPSVALTMQLRRALRLLSTLLRMWLGALLIVPRLGEAQRRLLIYRWAARLLDALAIVVRVRGEVPAGGRPVLLVANHVSWLDSYVIHTVNAARFVAKREIAGWPVVRTIAARVGTIFIKRACYRSAARTVGALAQALCGGQAVAAFPEATTSDGTGLLRFHAAMFEAAVRSGARVQPVAIRYRDRHGARTAAPAFVGEMTIADSLRAIVREPALHAELIFCPPIDPRGRTRRELAAQARAAIAMALGLEHAATPDRPLRRAA